MMHLRGIFIVFIILCCTGACQTSPPPATATLPTTAAITPQSLGIFAPTQAVMLPTQPPAILASAAPPTLIPPLPAVTETQQPVISDSTPNRTSTGTMFGMTASGLILDYVRIGDPSPQAQIIALIGGMHGGYEANTVLLMQLLIAHFTENLTMIPDGIALMIIPNANPDGYALGSGENGRFNGRGVDLNRNWACGWSREAFWRDQPVSSGSAPFSEPETAAISALLQTTQPVIALFYHSAAGGIFAGRCDPSVRGVDSEIMSAVYGQAAGYTFGQAFSAYPVTGTAASWADGLGIYAADVELFTRDDPEFSRNLAGIQALFQWLAAAP
jgi:hypothetical protein